MNTDKIEQLVQDSDLNQMQKNVSLGFIRRAKENEEKRTEARELVERAYGEKSSIQEIVVQLEDLIIFKVFPVREDDWTAKYPFRSILLKDDKWQRTNMVSPSLDIAFLIYLEKKYAGDNSQFTDFAMKMLEMKIEE